MTDKPVVLYDTTLRDGTQGENITLSLADKLRVARMLDEYGMPYVEGGWPGSNPKDVEFFKAARTMTWQTAKLAAFGSTRHRSNKAEDDPNLRELVAAETPVVTIFGKSWLLHVTEVLGATPNENLDMIADSVRFVVDRGRESVYDAEHFFDGYKADRDYALATLRAASQAGSRTLVLCDTNGGTLTDELARDRRRRPRHPRGGPDAPASPGASTPQRRRARRRQLAGRRRRRVPPRPGDHQRLRRALRQRQHGLDPRQPRVEDPARAGAGRGRLIENLTDLARSVAEIANLKPDDYQPYVGRSAFAHKAGFHGGAVAKFQGATSTRPATVGNVGRLVVSELGGKANTVDPGGATRSSARRGDRSQGPLEPHQAARVRGAGVRGRRGHFELLIRRHQEGYLPPFRIVDYTCLVEQRSGQELLAEATVKVEVDSEILHTAADGNGPVNALDAALRKALRAFYPHIDSVHLIDYKVRILDGDAATAARTRVIIDSSDGAREWSTMGSDTNIIAASATALADSLEYAIWKSGAELRRRDERHFTTAPAGRSTTMPTTTGRPRGGGYPDAPSRALDGDIGLEREQPGRGRHRVRRSPVGGVRGGQRRDRRAVPSGRRGARRRPHRPSPSARLRGPCARRGTGRRGPGDGPLAPPSAPRAPEPRAPIGPSRRRRTSSRPRSRPTSRRSTSSSPRSTGPARPSPPATASVPGSSREEAQGPPCSELDPDEANHDTTAWFER